MAPVPSGLARLTRAGSAVMGDLRSAEPQGERGSGGGARDLHRPVAWAWPWAAAARRPGPPGGAAPGFPPHRLPHSPHDVRPLGGHGGQRRGVRTISVPQHHIGRAQDTRVSDSAPGASVSSGGSQHAVARFHWAWRRQGVPGLPGRGIVRPSARTTRPRCGTPAAPAVSAEPLVAQRAQPRGRVAQPLQHGHIRHRRQPDAARPRGRRAQGPIIPRRGEDQGQQGVGGRNHPPARDRPGGPRGALPAGGPAVPHKLPLLSSGFLPRHRLTRSASP